MMIDERMLHMHIILVWREKVYHAATTVIHTLAPLGSINLSAAISADEHDRFLVEAGKPCAKK